MLIPPPPTHRPSHEFAVKPAKEEVCLADPFNSAAVTATDSSESHCYSIFKAKFEGIMAAAAATDLRRPPIHSTRA